MKLRYWVISLMMLVRVHGETFPPVLLTAQESRLLYQQARMTPGAQQIGLSCAFFANVPLFTMTSGINIADGSEASRQFVSTIYGLRKGDFKFTSAFDREMFFQIFSISAKGDSHYYREAPRVDLLPESKEIITRQLAKALDQGMFVSLRVNGTYGGPHNVLLLAHRNDTYYFHDPIAGSIASLAADELASKVLCESKTGTREVKRYYTSYHLVSLPAPTRLSENFLKVGNLPQKLELKPTPEQLKIISLKLAKTADQNETVKSFPHVKFVASKNDGKSMISQDLEIENMKGVFNLSKLAINCCEQGTKTSLPVWLVEGVPLVAIGYSEGAKDTLVFSDGVRRSEMSCDDALRKFKQSGCFYGYIEGFK